MPIKVNQVFKNLQPGLEIPIGDLVILTGQNNGGKSAILQYANIHGGFGEKSDYVSPRRFDTSYEVAVGLNFDQEQRNQQNQRKQFNEQQSEFHAPDPIRELVALSNNDRDEVVKWHNAYFGELQVARSNAGNDYSAPRITIDGLLATQQGSGSRAVLAILVKLFDPKIEHLFIDEPEIGVEPQVQRKLLDLIRKVSAGKNGAPKKKICIATHSHLFLDKQNITNNYIVFKGPEKGAVIRQVTTEQELYMLVFKLLGNSPDDLFFPRNIIIVEGPSDRLFLNRVLALRGAEAIAVHYADSDEKVGVALPAIDQMLKSTSYIPLYRERVCILVDKQTKEGLVQSWKDYLGGDGKRVLELAKNGIEHYYPRALMLELTTVAEAEYEAKLEAYLTKIRMGEKDPSFGAFKGGKVALARAVADRMTADHLPGLDSGIVALIDEAKRLGSVVPLVPAVAQVAPQVA